MRKWHERQKDILQLREMLVASTEYVGMIDAIGYTRRSVEGCDNDAIVSCKERQ